MQQHTFRTKACTSLIGLVDPHHAKVMLYLASIYSAFSLDECTIFRDIKRAR